MTFSFVLELYKFAASEGFEVLVKKKLIDDIEKCIDLIEF